MYVKYEYQPKLATNGKKCVMIGSQENKNALREWMWKTQNKKCFWCERPLTLPMRNAYNARIDHRKENSIRDRATFDHTLPKCSGGKNVLNNLVVCCRDCNESRSSLNFKGTLQWYKELKKKVPPLN